MRKRLFLSFILCAFIGSSFAQNLQLHYDFRNSLNGDEVASRYYFTATFEMFKPDKWGSTFMFIDANFDFSRAGVGLMYTEIARDFKIDNFPLMPHIEYNGGLGIFKVDDNTTGGFSIPNAYLLGFSYPFKLGNAFCSTYLAYKYNAFAKASHDVQWTGTWNANLANNKVTLSGFIDVWTENKVRYDVVGGDNSSHKKVILLTEPQIWYNFTPNFSMGSEVEISSNFIGDKAYVNPTIAAKWNF